MDGFLELDRGLVIIGPTDVIENDTVIAFDLDHTLIKPANGRILSKSLHDWVWLNDQVKLKLHELKNRNCGLVIFTNQAGIENGRFTPGDFAVKMESIFTDLGFRILTFVSTGHTKYRKPSPRMFEYFVENFAPSVNILNCKFVGDSAGRYGDWSSDDKLFAYNCGLDFALPIPFFESETLFDVYISHPLDQYVTTIDHYDEIFEKRIPHELVIFVGPPASGKSFFTKRYFSKYTVISQDTIRMGNPGTRAHCIRAMNAAVKSGVKKIVIDNTSPSAESREEYIKIARRHGMLITIINMRIPISVCKHLNFLRMLKDQRSVPTISYRVWRGRFQEPKTSEYDFMHVITHIPFDTFETSKELRKIVSKDDHRL